jgi:hypothetical protein
VFESFVKKQSGGWSHSAKPKSLADGVGRFQQPPTAFGARVWEKFRLCCGWAKACQFDG